MADIHRPISESYWVEPGHLLAGEYPGGYDQERTRKRIDALIEAGFDTFIDLTGAGETFAYVPILYEQAAAYGVSVDHLRYHIGDFGVPTPKLMNSILNELEVRLRAGRKIYLHCWGGVGRTGTTVGCYLVRQGKTGDEALNQLATWWRSVPKSIFHRHSPETREQMRFVRTWAKHDEKLRSTRT